MARRVQTHVRKTPMQGVNIYTGSEPDELLTIAETADLLKCSTDSIRRSISRGDLKAYRVNGRAIRLYWSDVVKTFRPVTPAADLLRR